MLFKTAYEVQILLPLPAHDAVLKLDGKRDDYVRDDCVGNVMTVYVMTVYA